MNKKSKQTTHTNINPRYYSNLTTKNAKKHIANIRKGREEYKKGVYKIRNTPNSYKHKPSRHVVNFHRIYGISTKNINSIYQRIGVSPSKQKAILSKGKGAYFSAGSIAGQTPSSWAYARLASALLGRGACKIDKDILFPITCKQLKALSISMR